MSENVTTTMPMGPKRPLYKTNYFNNLKKKASVKDLKEQQALNKELLSCIKQLSAENESLKKLLSEAIKSQNTQFTALSRYINGQLVPYMRSIAVATGCVQAPEESKEEKEEVSVDNSDAVTQEGGEPMDA